MNRPIVISIITIALVVMIGPWAQGVMTMGELDCWACHGLPNINTELGVRAANQLCFQCHQADAARNVDGIEVPLVVSPSLYRKTAHGGLACFACHRDVAATPHKTTGEMDCQSCHRGSAARMVVAEHGDLSCIACHLDGGEAARNDSGWVDKARIREKPMLTHNITKDVDCHKCHNQDNTVGAPGWIVPKKGVLCAPCHPSHASLTTPWSVPILLIFLIGIILNLSFWFKGSIPGANQNIMAKAAFILGAFVSGLRLSSLSGALQGLISNGVLHVRLFKESLARWLGHMMVFGMFAVRFLLSVYILLAARYYPLAVPGQKLAGGQTPWISFIYDASGLIVLIGIILAWSRRILRNRRLPQSAGPDWVLLAIIALIFTAGLGVDMAQGAITTRTIPGLAFMAALGQVLLPVKVAFDVHRYLWVAHVLLVYAAVAYLPYSKAWHMIVSPIIAMINYREKN